MSIVRWLGEPPPCLDGYMQGDPSATEPQLEGYRYRGVYVTDCDAALEWVRNRLSKHFDPATLVLSETPPPDQDPRFIWQTGSPPPGTSDKFARTAAKPIYYEGTVVCDAPWFDYTPAKGTFYLVKKIKYCPTWGDSIGAGISASVNESITTALVIGAIVIGGIYFVTRKN